MKLTEIKYKDTIIKVTFESIEDYAVYHYDKNKLVIRKGLSKRILGKTLFHELFHIIITLNKFSVSNHGEEKVAGLCEEYYNILRQNKVLRNLINRCIMVE